MPQVQQSVVLESYLENVKTQLAAIKIAKLKNNLSSNEVKAPKGVNSFLSHHMTSRKVDAHFEGKKDLCWSATPELSKI